MHVTWDIDIEDAETPREAAERAWDLMRRPGSTANVFTVIDEGGAVHLVDLELVGDE